MKNSLEPTLCIGIMSGTSLDGVDIALCSFSGEFSAPEYNIEKAETIPYPKMWKERLSQAHTLTAYNFCKLDNEYGEFLGNCLTQFLLNNSIPKEKISFIASHGHTIFHHPSEKITVQIGNGTSIYAQTGITVVFDFRRLDVARGGQGAPLVPIGDKLLFNRYTYRLNLGGFANISYNENQKIVAFDIVPLNFVLNHLAQHCGYSFDKDGEIAQSGNVIPEVLEKLNSLPFYQTPPPKSLGREWVEKHIFPYLETNLYSIPDLMRTWVEHAAIQISNIANQPNSTMLATGGGAHNKFFIHQLQQKTQTQIIIPNPLLIDFKEALIFAFLGWLKTNQKLNTLKEYTGAKTDSISGIIISE